MIFEHKAVLLKESIKQLNISIDGIYVDGTLGGGGHCKEILKRLTKKGKIIAIDQDIEAIEYCKFQFEKVYKNITFVHDNFSNISNILSELNINSIDGMILDLGVSSHQLDVAKRGFSYMKNSYLDMRMDNRNSLSAYDVVNTYDEKKLYKVIKEYGEERWAKRIVSFIILERKKGAIETTFDLVNVIKKAIPKKFRYERSHPAKRVFQAIRIEVNDELNILKNTVSDVVDRLKSKGRLCVITFHSLEDRIIKNIFKDLEYPCKCPKEFPICICGKIPKVKIITKKPIMSTAEEVKKNHRCRSAKLRVIEKL